MSIVSPLTHKSPVDSPGTLELADRLLLLYLRTTIPESARPVGTGLIPGAGLVVQDILVTNCCSAALRALLSPGMKFPLCFSVQFLVSRGHVHRNAELLACPGGQAFITTSASSPLP